MRTTGTWLVPSRLCRMRASSEVVTVFSVKGTPRALSKARPASQAEQAVLVYSVTG